MKLPDVVTTVKDIEKDVTYQVVAYRKLSRGEAFTQIGLAHADKKFKKPKKGQTIKILTIIGFNE